MNLTLALALAALGTSDGTPAPLQATAPSVDLGEVKSGPACKHTFEVKNAGTASVSICDVVSGCGCSKVELSAKQLRAGETASVTVVTSTLTQPEGPVSWPVTLAYTTEADGKAVEGKLELKLTAKLLREVSVTPPVLALSTTGTFSHTLKVEDRRAKPLSVSKAESTSKHITAEVKAAKTTDGKTVQEVLVTVKDELAVGSHTDTVTLRTDDPACPTLEVPVRVHKRAADGVTATPAAASVRFASGQAEASALVQLRGGGKTVAIKGVECGTAGVTVKFSEDAGPVATVRVIVTAAKAGASGTAEVTVTLTEPTATKIVIPVTWYAP
jgi:hypothetical protein